jgi:flagellar biosynthetic protein FliR
MEIMVTQLVLFLLIFARVMAMVAAAPVFGNESIPVQLKIAIGMFIAFVMFPMLSHMALQVDVRLFAMVILMIKEVAVGLILGFAAGFIFGGVRYAGELISFMMGFSLASIVDPESGQQNGITSEFMYMVTLLVFLIINGHHFVLEALQMSYVTVPIGGLALKGPLLETMITLGGVLFILAVKLAAPILVALFMINVALAVLARVSPQMNVFMLSFPLNIGVGMTVLITTAPLMVFVFKKSLLSFEEGLLELVKVM